ncbi:MAG: hypothetical protein ACJ8CB_09360, partial [Ktedonobacteraceae bacterium]
DIRAWIILSRLPIGAGLVPSQRMIAFALDQRNRGEIGAVLLFIVIVRLPQYHYCSYPLCGFVVHHFSYAVLII